ncbi:hypothetical protein GCM10029964_014050 [Kibdelosporangium lantanae]
MTVANESELGALQDLWDAWDPAHREMLTKEPEHFYVAWQVQVDELRQHLRDNDKRAALNEMVDIISISLNFMRNMGCSPPTSPSWSVPGPTSG